jgi:predicted RNA binding protein YcfA (HicA-like mRNA interferase family)
LTKKNNFATFYVSGGSVYVFRCSLARKSFVFDIKTTIFAMKYSELEKRLRKAGCYLIDVNGRHPTWYSPITDREFQTSHHKSEEVKRKTLFNILKDAGIK